MKLIATFTLVLAAAAIQAQDRGRSQPGESRDITELLRAWDTAYQRRDTEALGRLLAADYVMTDASGSRLTRTEYLMSVIKTPEFTRVRSWESVDVVVRINGNRADVTGVSQVKGRPRGRAMALEAGYRFTDVWVKRNGTWQAVSTMATRIE